MDTTTTRRGAHYGDHAQMESIHAYISGDDTLTDTDAETLADALFAALRGEVDARLPEDVTWHPRTADFAHPVDVEVPDADEMAEIFEAAWAAVEARYEDIERDALGTLPADVETLEQELRAITDPIRRARVASMLVDAGTRQMAGHVRAEAVHEATRSRSRAEVADLLGTGVAAVEKLIGEHNRRSAA